MISHHIHSSVDYKGIYLQYLFKTSVHHIIQCYVNIHMKVSTKPKNMAKTEIWGKTLFSNLCSAGLWEYRNFSGFLLQVSLLNKGFLKKYISVFHPVYWCVCVYIYIYLFLCHITQNSLSHMCVSDLMFQFNHYFLYKIFLFLLPDPNNIDNSLICAFLVCSAEFYHELLPNLFRFYYFCETKNFKRGLVSEHVALIMRHGCLLCICWQKVKLSDMASRSDER